MVDRLLERVLPLLTSNEQRDEVSESADQLIESLEKGNPTPSTPAVNPPVEWAQLDEEAEEYKRRQKESRDATEPEETRS